MVLFFFHYDYHFLSSKSRAGAQGDWLRVWVGCVFRSKSTDNSNNGEKEEEESEKVNEKKIKKSPPCFILTTPPFDLGRPYVFLLPQNGPDTRSFPRLLRVSLPAFQPGIRIRLLFLLLLLLPPETLAQILHFFFSSRIFASCLLYYLSYPTFENRKNRLLVRNWKKGENYTRYIR